MRTAKGAGSSGETEDSVPRSSGGSVAEPLKKPYRRPTIRSYGQIADLTRDEGTQNTDTGFQIGNIP